MNSPEQASPEIPNLTPKDLVRIDADLTFLRAMLSEDQARAFFANPGVTRDGKLQALRRILEPRVHPVVTRFMISLATRSGARALVPTEGGYPVKHYALACVDLAGWTACMDTISNDMVLADSVLQLKEVRAFLANSAVEDEGKTVALQGILAGRVSPQVLFLVLFLFRMSDLGKFSEITSRCLTLVAERQGSLSGELISAVPVLKDKLLEIERAAGIIFGKQLHLTPRIDSALLGGVVIKAGDLVLDATIDHQLAAIRRSLLGASA
jgi:F-type H+-transporting ATPase subunit delta